VIFDKPRSAAIVSLGISAFLVVFSLTIGFSGSTIHLFVALVSAAFAIQAVRRQRTMLTILSLIVVVPLLLDGVIGSALWFGYGCTYSDLLDDVYLPIGEPCTLRE
jgi:hypothetical protein